MRGNRRLVGAVLVSVLLHGLLLSFYEKPILKTPEKVVLDLVLEQPPEPEVEEAVLEPEEPPQEEEPPPEEPLVGETPRETELIGDPETEPVVEPEHTVLNMEQPENWDTLIDRLPDPDVKLAFNRDLKERVTVRDGEKRRTQLVEDRVAAVYGVPDELYTREGPLGTEIKINGKCYVLMENPAVEAGSRWWGTQCKDTKISPFLLDPIEYDAIGRVVAD